MPPCQVPGAVLRSDIRHTNDRSRSRLNYGRVSYQNIFILKNFVIVNTYNVLINKGQVLCLVRVC